MSQNALVGNTAHVGLNQNTEWIIGSVLYWYSFWLFFRSSRLRRFVFFHVFLVPIFFPKSFRTFELGSHSLSALPLALLSFFFSRLLNEDLPRLMNCFMSTEWMQSLIKHPIATCFFFSDPPGSINAFISEQQACQHFFVGLLTYWHVSTKNSDWSG